MYSVPNVRSFDNRQRRLRSPVPRVEQLEDRLQPSALLLGDGLVSDLAPDPEFTASADDKGQIHLLPSTGQESTNLSTPPAVSISSAGGQASGPIGVAQAAMPAKTTQSATPPLTQNALASSAAQEHPALSTASSRALSIRPMQGHELTLLQETIRLISQQTALTAASSPAPVQHHFGGDATQNWATYVTNTTSSATGQGIVLDSNGNIYVTGSTDQGSTKTAFVAAYDANGNQLFLTKFQAKDVTTGVNYNHSQGNALALDASGNIYVTGQATNPTTRLQDAFVMRLSSSGKVDSTYGVGFDTGGLGNVSGNSIVVTPNGVATIAGSARFLGNDVFIAQVAASGSVTYGNAFPPADFEDSTGSSLYNAVTANGIAFSSDGSMAYVSGTGTHADGTSDIIVTLIDTATGSQPTGFSAVSNPGGAGNGIVVGADGTVYQSGTTTIQSNGQAATYAVAISWTSDLSNTNYEVYDSNSLTGTGIAVDPTGNVYMSGTASDTLGNTRALVDFLDPTGAISDTLLIADMGSGNESGTGIVYSQGGTVYVTGSTSSSNLSTDGTSLNGQQDAFLANVGNFMT
jgi:hypothetical protein